MKIPTVFLILLCGTLILHAQRTVDAVQWTARYGLPQSYEDIYNDKSTEIGSIILFVIFSISYSP